MKTRTRVAVLTALFVTGASLWGFDANAFLRRQGALGCMFDPGQALTFGAGKKWEVAGNQLRWNNSTTTERGTLLCALLDDDSAPFKSLAWVSFQGYDGNTNASSDFGQLSASPCITFQSGISGGVCGTATSSSKTGTGVVDLGLDLTVFNNKGTFDFPYLFVGVPAVQSGGSTSSFWGINWST